MNNDYNLSDRIKHIAFIMDGNGRWAKERGKPRSFGHMEGVRAIRPIIDDCFFKYSINTVSLFVFSSENWKRDGDEIKYLFMLLKAFFKSNINELIEKGVRITVSGDLEDKRIPRGVKKVIQDAIKKSSSNKLHTFNILFNYGGRQEILNAVKCVANGVKEKSISIEDIDDDLFSSYLYTGNLPNVDLLIRTSGEQRLSNCILYGLSYAELIFNKVYWPDYNKTILESDLNEFINRKRRYGGVNE